LYYSRTRIIADCILLYINKDQIIADYINRTKIIDDCISLYINRTKISTDYVDRTNMIADCISLYADRTKMIADCISLYADRTKMIADCISVWKDSLNSDCQQSRQYQNRTNNHLSPQKIAHKKTQDMTMKIKVLVLDRQKNILKNINQMYTIFQF
jgi:uncharacterized cysteine cluster protein YcgN (CxxCxxCC family)